jgi:hypothetical protein
VKEAKQAKGSQHRWVTTNKIFAPDGAPTDDNDDDA